MSESIPVDIPASGDSVLVDSKEKTVESGKFDDEKVASVEKVPETVENVLESDISPVNADTPENVSPGSPESAVNPVGSDASSVKSVSSGTVKKSGLKVPTKIGRPCAGQTKPAIPATPVKGKPNLKFFNFFCFLKSKLNFD